MRHLPPSNDWATPPKFYNKLNKEFNFDFDPCPLYHTEDGLLNVWGDCNFINPPYSSKLKQAFVHKSVEVSRSGRVCVLLLPVVTSSVLFHEVIIPAAKDIRFIKGRLPFIGIDRKGQYVNWHLWDNKSPPNVKHVKCNGMFDSMIVVM